MKPDFLFYARHVPKARLKLTLGILLGFMPVVLLIVRLADLPLKASIKMFASAPAASPMQGLDMLGIAGRFSALERDTLISSQEALVSSQIVFRAVQERLRADTTEDAGEKTITTARWIRNKIRPLKVMLFGEDYVVAREKYVDWDYLAFKEKVKFNSQLEAGSFTIEYRDPDPERALRVTQTIAEELISLNRSIANEQMTKTVAFLAKKVQETRKELERSADQIVAFVRENSFPNSTKYLDLRYEALLDGMVKVGDAKAKVKANQAMLKTLKETASALTAAIRGKITDVDGASKVDVLLAEMQRFQAGRLQSDGAHAEADQLLDERLQSMRQQLADVTKDGKRDALLDLPSLRALYQDVARQSTLLESEIASASKYLQESNESLEMNQAEVAKFPELQAKLSQMMIDHSQVVQVLTVLTELYYKNMIQSDSNFSSLVIIEDPAIASSTGSSKPILLISLTAFLVMVLLGCLSGYHLLRGTIFSSEQLRGLAHTTYLGSIPHFPRRKNGLSIVDQGMTNDVVSRLGYALKKRISSSEIPGHTVVICGNDTTMGKSVAAVILAHSLRRKGMRVALIDFDVRALDRNVVTHLPPGIKVHELGPVVPNEAAIRRALADQNESAPIVFHFNTRTDVNSPRPIAPDGPADALDRVLSILRRDLDVIVVDGPPLFVSDACMLAERADSILLCCKQGRTTAAEMEEALSTLEKHRRKNTDIMTLLTHANDTDAFGVSARYRYSYERSRKAS